MLGRLVNRHLAFVPPEHPWGDTLSLLRSADALNCQSGVRHFGPRWALAGTPTRWTTAEALEDCIAVLVRHGIRPIGAGS